MLPVSIWSAALISASLGAGSAISITSSFLSRAGRSATVARNALGARILRIAGRPWRLARALW
jgi:hypothetical protein